MARQIISSTYLFGRLRTLCKRSCPGKVDIGFLVMLRGTKFSKLVEKWKYFQAQTSFQHEQTMWHH